MPHLRPDILLATITIILGAAGMYLLLPHSHGSAKPKQVQKAGYALIALSLILLAGWLNFNVARSEHTNLGILWIISGFIGSILRYTLPTRYCESDLLGAVARQTFGTLPTGHQRVQAICDWVHQSIEYRIGSTDATTTARDVFLQRAGVCRDFAHLSIAFCRALNIPARLVSGYARFDDPPPDFHAVFEAYLGGRWVLFDPTRMVPVDHLVRVAHGLDAKDVAFATIYGPARMTGMSPEVETITTPSTRRTR